MKNLIDDIYLNMVQHIMNTGEDRQTRSGMCRSNFDYNGSVDLEGKYLPLLTTKKIQLRALVGELLWFLSGKSTISSLKHYTFNDSEADKWTIWTDDQKRWQDDLYYRYMVDHNIIEKDSCGENYGVIWRGTVNGVDQIQNLLSNITEKPFDRRLIVQAYLPDSLDMTCLPPCHTGFQCYVRKGEWLDLKWTQRSCDVFLGFPFNLASYGLLLHILAKLTGLKAGRLSWTLGDAHVYHPHFDAVKQQMQNDPFPELPTIELPEFDSLDYLVDNLTANDFMNCVKDYQSHEPIKAPLLVG